MKGREEMPEKNPSNRREFLKQATAGAVVAGAAATSLMIPKESFASGQGARMAMVIDLRRCIGCRGCSVACKTENNVPLGVWNAAVKNIDWGQYPTPKKGFLPVLCNHCEGADQKDGQTVPPCVNDCPQHPIGKITHNGQTTNAGATFKRADGSILYDRTKCIGCGACVEACPYGARHFDAFNKLTNAEKVNEIGIGKCTFCAHRIDNGVVPSCVNTCTGRARIFGDLNDPNSEVARLLKTHKVETLLTEEGTKPQVFYIESNGVLKHADYAKMSKEERYRDQFV